MVKTGSLDKLAFGPFHQAVPTDATALPGWLGEGARDLLATFSAAPPGRPVWSFGPDQHARSWPRRMLHEAAVHRSDATLALGRQPTIPVAVAHDGIEEFLTNVLRHPRVATPAATGLGGRTLALAATDTDQVWRIRCHATQLGWRRGTSVDRADAVIHGATEQLYLWQRSPAPSITGDLDLVAAWRAATTF